MRTEGATGGTVTTAVGLLSDVADPPVFVAVTSSRMYFPSWADVITRVSPVASAMLVQLEGSVVARAAEVHAYH